MVEVGPMPYPVLNTILDDGFPTGALNDWLSSFTRGLDSGLIDTAVERFATAPSPMSAIVFEHFHGAVTRVGVTDTAVPHREKGWNLALATVWMDRFAALHVHFSGRRRLNYLATTRRATRSGQPTAGTATAWSR